MKRRLLPFLLLIFTLSVAHAQEEQYIRKIYDEALTNGHAYEWLHYLTKDIGNRLSGSPEAAAAVEWTRQVMDTLGLDTVYLQPVMVPHWVRGKPEKAMILGQGEWSAMPVDVLAIGNSVGTGTNGVRAEIIEVPSLEGLEKLTAADVKGKIVFFNGAMDATQLETFRAYGKAVMQRALGASKAAELGAVGVVVRSVASNIDDFPHTGTLHYLEGIKKIPAVCISTEDAETLSHAIRRSEGLEFYFETHARMLPDELSYNVIGELRGSEEPDQYLVVGGHLDSWDVGEGAHDDGSGCVQSIEALRIFKKLGYQPKKTIRAVMFMNEENGSRGAAEYARMAEKNKEKHIAAIESDAGGFAPRGFAMTGKKGQVETFKSWRKWLEPFGLYDLGQPGGGEDIDPLKEAGVALFGLRPESQRYFNYHHTNEDTFEKVDPRELELGAAGMASLLYLLDNHKL